jgi:hypothetical protein
MMAGGSAHVVILGLLFLKVSGIRQQDPEQVDGGGRRVHCAAEPVGLEPRQVSAVVDVRVRQHDVIDRPRLDGQALPVAAPQRLQPLVETALDENSPSSRDEQELGSRDGTCSAEELQRRLAHEPVIVPWE